MSTSAHRPSREDVLDAFSVEHDPGRQALERYIRDYPQYAEDLVDLSRELSRAVVEDGAPLSAEDRALIEAAWLGHMGTAPTAVGDPLSCLSVDALREVAKCLNVPRQIITAFRERRVVVASVPRRFMALLADALNAPIEVLTSALMLPPTPLPGRSYKADAKPRDEAPVVFEQLLIDANVSIERRAELMKDGD